MQVKKWSCVVCKTAETKETKVLCFCKQWNECKEVSRKLLFGAIKYYFSNLIQKTNDGVEITGAVVY